MIEAEKIVVGPLETNCYIIREADCCVVIDPGDDFEKIYEKIKGRTLAAILLTHGHFDHMLAVSELKAATGAKVYMHRGDKAMIGSRERSLSFMGNTVPAPFEVDVFVENGDILRFGEIEMGVLHTPGHSPGGVSYVLGMTVFCGDLIFRRSIGRSDFGDYEEEMASIRRLLAAFPDETLLCPGHGERTTIGEEKLYNPFLR